MVLMREGGLVVGNCLISLQSGIREGVESGERKERAALLKRAEFHLAHAIEV